MIAIEKRALIRYLVLIYCVLFCYFFECEEGVQIVEKIIIPSVVDFKFLDKACHTNSPVIFLTKCSIGNLQSVVKKIHEFGKLAFVHLEFVEGFKPDTEGLKLMRNMFKVDGVISTNTRSLLKAKSVGLQTVFRLFLVDSVSYERTIQILKKNKFSGLELLPAINGVAQLDLIEHQISGTPLIAGGFIRTEQMVENVFSTDFVALDTSSNKLWRVNNKTGRK